MRTLDGLAELTERKSIPFTQHLHLFLYFKNHTCVPSDSPEAVFCSPVLSFTSIDDLNGGWGQMELALAVLAVRYGQIIARSVQQRQMITGFIVSRRHNQP